MNIQNLLLFLMELIGTIAFAASGVMVGIRKNMDLFGVCVLGTVTAVGGGTIRDIVLCQIPSALLEPIYVETSVITALLIFGFLYFKADKNAARFHNSYDRVMQLMDAIGLGIFTAVGVMTGIKQGYTDNTFLLAFLGTVTGVGGGLLRDMMAGNPPYIFVKHIYACASIVGAVVCVYMNRFVGNVEAMMVACFVVILIRYLAAHYRWNLPRLSHNESEK